jgi:chromosome segregation ATPase
MGMKGRDTALETERKRAERELESAVLSIQTVEREEARMLYAYQRGAIDVEQLQGSLTELKKCKAGLVAERDKIAERTQQRSKRAGDLKAIKAVSVQAREGFHKMTFERKRATLEVMDIKVHVYPERFEITGLLTEKLTILLQEPKPLEVGDIVYAGSTAFAACAST